MSLRSRPDGIDVSELATKFGGGGHPHAAGFRLKEAPCLRTSFEVERLGHALGLLSTIRHRPQMFASMREAFVAQVWAVVFMVGVDADMQDFYKKALGRQGSAVLGLDAEVGTEWARGVIDEAVALLPMMDAAGWIAQQETD